MSRATASTTAPTASPWSGLLRPALVLFVLLSLLTGLAYPLLVTAVAQVAMTDSANGSLIVRDNQVVGSRLVGQAFSNPAHFWSRPSATGPMPYNGEASSGSNLGPSNPALADAVRQRVAALRAADPGNAAPVPVDLVTTSASGLDPHISRAAADYQVPRVARLRGMPQAELVALVDAHTAGRWLGLIGEPRVNVLTLNLALQARATKQAP